MLEQFLKEIELKAYKMALLATKSEDVALDLVQNSMMKMVEKYATHNVNELKPIFYAVLQNQIKNWYRRETLVSKWFSSFRSQDDDEQDFELHVEDDYSPEDALLADHESARLMSILEQLPIKQQQCFLLRSWEGLSVRETANIMKCSEGSVKTHMSRASKKLNRVIECGDVTDE